MINIIHGILLILYIIDCIALTVVVLMQEGKQASFLGHNAGFVNQASVIRCVIV